MDSICKRACHRYHDVMRLILNPNFDVARQFSVSLFLLGLAAMAASVDAQVTDAPPDPPAPASPLPATIVERIPATGIPEWTVVDERRFVREPRRTWHLYLEETTSGHAKSKGREIDIRQTRIRVAEKKPGSDRELDLGYIQHLSNLEVAVLDPGDPRVDEPAVRHDDPDNPWPNVAGLHFFETPRSFDIDRDDRNEFVVRYYATVGSPEARGVLVISEDEFGMLRIVPPTEFVGTVRAENLHLVDLSWTSTAVPDPIIRAQLLSLSECRFLAQLGIRGEAGDCKDCCSLPIFLERSTDSQFHPIFDRQVQGTILDRVRGDIARISQGPEDQDLSSLEQAALSRMASFFYLTGSARSTRANLEKALGPRAEMYKTRLLLERLESYFLQQD